MKYIHVPIFCCGLFFAGVLVFESFAIFAQYDDISGNPVQQVQNINEEEEEVQEEEEPTGIVGFIQDIEIEDVQQAVVTTATVAAPTATVGGAVWWIFLKPV